MNLLACFALIAVIALYVAHEDLTSDGLKRTQMFLVLGYAIYPLFYGACIFGMWKLVSLYRRANSFVTLNGSSLFVWSKEIPLQAISSITVRRGLLFLRWLIIEQRDGTETKVSSLALTQPVYDVAARLQTAARVN